MSAAFKYVVASRVSVLVGILVMVLILGFSVPAAARPHTSGTVKVWPIPFAANELGLAPDGSVFFTVPGVSVGRLNPQTNQLTTWNFGAFHLEIGPRFSVQFDGKTYTEDYTVAFIRLNGQVRLLLPNSGLYVQWVLPAPSSDITSSGSRLWVTLFDTDSTEVASLNLATNVLTRYDLPQTLAGPDGFIHGLSFGKGRLWYGVTSQDLGGTGNIVQKTGSLDPESGSAKVWTLFSTPGSEALIGRSATFAADSAWTFYHSTDPSLTGVYRLKPGEGEVSFYGAPLGTPGPGGGLPSIERVDRATKVAGSAWAASSSQAGGVESAQVVRWHPLGSEDEFTVVPEEPTVTVSTMTLAPAVFPLVMSITTITPVETAATGTFVSPNITIWSFADRSLASRFTVSPSGVVYFGLMIPSTGEAFLSQLSSGDDDN